MPWKVSGLPRTSSVPGHEDVIQGLCPHCEPSGKVGLPVSVSWPILLLLSSWWTCGPGDLGGLLSTERVSCLVLPRLVAARSFFCGSSSI